MKLRGEFAGALAGVILSTGVAAAQPVATSFQELGRFVKSGDTIYVTDAAGHTTKGRLGDLSSTSLDLLVPKTASDGRETLVSRGRVSESDVRQIARTRRDPVWKGLLIGTAVVGGPCLLLCNPATDWCYYGDGANLYRSMALITTGIGAGIGALIDAAITERTMVYYRAPAHALSRVRISPVVSKSRTGVRMAVTF